MLSRRTLIVNIIGAAAALGIRGAAADQPPVDPKSFIEQLSLYAVDALTDPSLPNQEREQRFRSMLNRNFDLSTIGRFVLGRYWHSASEAERAEFLMLFEDFIVKSYAARFADYSGERFQILGVRQEDGGYAIVQSRVIRPRAESVRVDWRLRNRDGAYRVVDIVIEGISMAVTQRADFASAIQSSGGSVDGLLRLLRRKTGQMS